MNGIKTHEGRTCVDLCVHRFAWPPVSKHPFGTSNTFEKGSHNNATYTFDNHDPLALFSAR